MSGSHFRALSTEQRPAFRQFLDYAFSPEDGPQEYDSPDAVPDQQGQPFGLVIEDELKSVCAHHEFTASLRGEWVPVAGLAAVATMPEYRRQGYVRTMVENSLRRWRGESPLAALWPFDYSYYEQFGWAMGCTYTRYSVDPAALAGGRDAPGTYRRIDSAEWSLLQPAHEEYALGHDLTIRRTAEWWRERIFQTETDKSRYVYALERDGSIRGYVAYTVEADGGSRTLKVVYNAFTDHDAYRGLLGFLSTHDSQVEEIDLFRGPETTLFDVVTDPSKVECTVNPGTMVRVVDVPDALETLPYPDDCSGTVTLAVSDDTAPWNDDQFELSVSDGRGTCRRIEDGSPDDRLDVQVDIETLSQLVVGYHDVDDARNLAALQVADEEAASRLSAWFPPRTVHPMDSF